MNVRNKQIINRVIIIILLVVLAAFIQIYNSKNDSKIVNEAPKAGVVEVHFIDVGQGDSILVETDTAAMLIDAGDNNKGQVVVDYLKSQNIKKLDYVIGTHPHSDHIGGMDTVLNAFPVDTIIMPDMTSNSKTFEDVLDAVEKQNLRITKSVVGTEYNLGQAFFTILAPNTSSYYELNDYSIVIKLTNGSNTFLLTGDAGIRSEEEMLANGEDLSADVLKIAHHGSTSASSDSFLDAVNPTYAVISVGKDNEYGHPNQQILQALNARNIEIYRTDVQGTIVFTSDGKNISVNKDKCD